MDGKCPRMNNEIGDAPFDLSRKTASNADAAFPCRPLKSVARLRLSEIHGGDRVSDAERFVHSSERVS